MIKNIIFDFGNVLIPADEQKAHSAFEKIALSAGTKELKNTLNGFEISEISEKEFYDFFLEHTPNRIMKCDIQDAWNSMLGEIDLEDIRLLKRTQKLYSLYLASNTNPIHIKAIKEKTGPFNYKQFMACFKGIHLSYEQEKRKPKANFFENILKKEGLKSADSLFIDDREDNILAAEKLGFKTWHFKPESDKISDLGKVLSEHHS